MLLVNQSNLSMGSLTGTDGVTGVALSVGTDGVIVVLSGCVGG